MHGDLEYLADVREQEKELDLRANAAVLRKIEMEDGECYYLLLSFILLLYIIYLFAVMLLWVICS